MRNDTPQVETREIADNDLDNISGGLGVSAGAGIDGLSLPLSLPTTGLPLGEVTGLVSGLTNTVSGLTGLTGLTGITGIAGL